MSLRREDITAVILAGGKGRRMGGEDKGLMEFDGKPLVAILIDSLRRQGVDIVINANRNRERYEQFGCPVIADRLEDYQGPLAGFSSALHAVDRGFVLTLPCDGPLLAEDYVERFIDIQAESGARLCVAYDGERLQPVHALIDTGLRGSLDSFLDSGERKIDRWYALQDFARADFSDCKKMFRNINTPADRQALQTGRIKTDIPILGFSAWSGTGKTTLLRQLIPALGDHGLRVSVIKHAHHHFDLDVPGKDSFELRKAGAVQTVICTSTRMALITEFDSPADEPDLEQIINRLDTGRVDLVLVEGYKNIEFPKIELHRAEIGKPCRYPEDASVIALACDTAPPGEIAIPVLDINDVEAIARFICEDFYASRQKAER
ncbi:MAG: molybdenum cofactor guanylyltransferase MobA [Gammaproteobacteria bacterium]|jgi:molybdenum cofactor guanylyltransferase/molybdopterin-guanine dinucleotide biosynthesis protein MobB